MIDVVLVKQHSFFILLVKVTL